MDCSIDDPVTLTIQARIVGNAGGYVHNPALGDGTSNVPDWATWLASVLKPIQSTPNGRSNIVIGTSVRRQKHPLQSAAMDFGCFGTIAAQQLPVQFQAHFH